MNSHKGDENQAQYLVVSDKRHATDQQRYFIAESKKMRTAIRFILSNDAESLGKFIDELSDKRKEDLFTNCAKYQVEGTEDGRTFLGPSYVNRSWVYTLLDIACGFGNPDIFDLLIEKGASNYNKIQSGANVLPSGTTILVMRAFLHAAAQHVNLGVMKLLIIDYKVSPNARDVYGQTPLHVAVKNEQISAISFFLGKMI